MIFTNMRGVRVRMMSWLEDPRSDAGIAVATDTGEWQHHSYAEIAARAHAVAEVLDAAGARGRVVTIAVSDGVLFPAAFFGAWLAGATPSPVIPPGSGGRRAGSAYVEHVSTLLAAADPAVVLTTDDRSSLLGEALTASGRQAPIVTAADLPVSGRPAALHRPPDDRVILQFTSGSTGRPRALPISRSNLESNLDGIHRWTGLTPDSGTVTWLPFHHDMGLIGTLLAPVAMTGPLWIMRPEQYLRRPLSYLKVLGDGRASFTAAPTFGYGHLLHHVSPPDLDGLDLTGWRAALVGAERVDLAVLGRVYQLLRPRGFRRETFRPAYGLAEATLMVSGGASAAPARAVRLRTGRLALGSAVDVEDEAQLGDPRIGPADEWVTSCGTALPGTAVEIVDARREPVADGVLGELQVSGPSVAVAAAPPGAGGALLTGDAGFRWNGEIYVLGRMGDSLKVRGRVVFAEDLEARLLGVRGLPPGHASVVAGQRDGNPQVLVLAEAPTAAWADEAARVIRAEVGASVAITVAVGGKGTIARTSSGKPRRRQMWQSYLGDGPGLDTVLCWPAQPPAVQRTASRGDTAAVSAVVSR